MNIAALFHKHLWDTKASPARRHQINAIARHPEVNLTVTGPGWPGWEDGHSIAWNLRRIMPNGVDFIRLYKPEGSPKYGMPPMLRLSKMPAPACVCHNESWWPDQRAAKEAMQAHVSLVVCHHENDIPQFDSIRGLARIVHIPHCAEKAIFARDYGLERQIPVLVTGIVGKEFYPLRARMRDLVHNQTIPGRIRLHMGYEAKSLEANDEQVVDYARQLSQTKIMLTCTSKFKYGLAKIVEAMQAGCVVACDMPDDSVFKRTLGQYIIQIDPAWTDSQIANTIRHWLDHPEQLAAMAQSGKKVACENFAMENYAEQFVAVAKQFLQNPQTT